MTGTLCLWFYKHWNTMSMVLPTLEHYVYGSTNTIEPALILFFVLFIALKKKESISLSLAANLGYLTWVRLQQPQEQRYPFLPACAVFLRIQATARLSVFGILTYIYMHTCSCM